RSRRKSKSHGSAGEEPDHDGSVEQAGTIMNWQTPLTILIVLIALGDIVRRLWVSLSGRSQPGCGSACSGCSGGSTQEPQIVSLGTGSPRSHSAEN
ncbi:MAG: FeoB-associated Cys-rich membrane protein, partial [Planctomycetaceae bacterium]